MYKNDFHADDEWQRKVRDEHLGGFYRQIASHVMYLDVHDEQGDDSCVMAMQKELGVDTLAVIDGKILGIEEKIVRWPEDSEPHTAYALETDSCTLPGRHKDGWMCYSAADTLLYAFEQEDGTLLADLIPMQPLRYWFWETVTRPMFEKTKQRYRLYDYPMHQMATGNRTEVRIIPIEDVWEAVEGCLCYLIDHGEIIREASMDERLEKVGTR